MAADEAARPARIVDAHVHFWDPVRTDWYPYLSGGLELDMGDTAGMNRRFDWATYQREAAGWNVEKVVNVAAATGAHSVDETLELDRVADDVGAPHALIGGVLPSDSVADAIASVDRQSAASRFRGVRPMGRSADPLPPSEVLAALADRHLVFEVMAHPNQLAAVADGLAAHDTLTVVVEHTGWPRSGDDDDEHRLWRDGIDALAGLGPRVVCKLSGLAMPLGSMEPDAFRPWIEHALEVFGSDRCMFASNFPVDGLHGTLDQLWTTYATLAADLDDAARDQVFAGTAERIYRL